MATVLDIRIQLARTKDTMVSSYERKVVKNNTHILQQGVFLIETLKHCPEKIF